MHKTELQSQTGSSVSGYVCDKPGGVGGWCGVGGGGGGARAGFQRSAEGNRKGIQNGITCLIFCALQSWKGGREKKKGKEKKEQRLKAHISLRSHSPIF